MAGLAATSPDMYQTADKYMDDYAMYDVDIKSTIGFVAEDADKIAELGCVADVQAAKVVDMVLQLRAKAKADKDWATSDKIRDELAANGFEVKDTKDGVTWKLNK